MSGWPAMSERSESNGGGGIRTPLDNPDRLLHKPDKNATNPTQVLANTGIYEISQNSDFEQKLTLAEHLSDTFLHQKCAKCVHNILSDDLMELIECWPYLPENIRQSIQLLIKSTAR
jgi:hypothetical protein